ncbi:MAG: nicotinate (nicotinamide) nucleotide adenylyltransferase [Glaciecola sp.]|jgi:nicotinate-nucleotide adenylyltransferase
MTKYLFGGSFDPVHQGHILPLLDLQQRFGIPCIHLLPNRLSPLKQAHPPVSNAHRLAMLELVCAQYPSLAIEPWELEQPRVSYTIDTVNHFSQTQAVVFIMGMDSLLTLHHWRNFEQIIAKATLIVLARPGYDFALTVDTPAVIAQALRPLAAGPEQTTHWQPGEIHIIETPLIDMSSSHFRAAVQKSDWEHKTILPSVLNYIQKYHLYQTT